LRDKRTSEKALATACALVALLAIEPAALAAVVYYQTADQLYRAGIATDAVDPVPIDLTAGDSYANFALNNGWRTCGASWCAALMRGEYSDMDVIVSRSRSTPADAVSTGLPIGVFSIEGEAQGTANLDAVDVTTSFNAVPGAK
jgi:hypothetical protein